MIYWLYKKVKLTRIKKRIIRNKKIIINVTDTGCGISADKHEYVFQRFTKLNTFTLGNGLGLYLCRLIARHMNGNIKIDPNWSKGSKFIFTIPMGNNQTE